MGAVEEYKDAVERQRGRITWLERQLAEAQAERDSLRAVVAQVRYEAWCTSGPTDAVPSTKILTILASQPKVLAVGSENCKRVERSRDLTFYEIMFDVPGGYEKDLNDKHLDVDYIIIERSGE